MPRRGAAIATSSSSGAPSTKRFSASRARAGQARTRSGAPSANS